MKLPECQEPTPWGVLSVLTCDCGNPNVLAILPGAAPIRLHGDGPAVDAGTPIRAKCEACFVASMRMGGGLRYGRQF